MTIAVAYSLDVPLPPGTRALWCGGFVVAAVSLADDRWHISARVRFGAHIAGALILVAGGGIVHELVLPGGMIWELGWTGLPLTVLWVVSLTNAYNFMDGIDGLAAGQAVVAAVAMACLSYVRGGEVATLSLAILAGSVFGFLLHNWPPAAIFMGDVGSAFLGFTFAGWAVLSAGTRSGGLPLAAWVVVLAPFLLDAGITLALRVLRGQRWYQPHREHFYQRLVQRGWSHRAVTDLYVGVAAFLAIAAIGYYAK
jgi:UDP-N-acetylmuramyl pentapeptide phosphotransferase/UDP-N-acetylglucosamine-1-phosphate transferase